MKYSYYQNKKKPPVGEVTDEEVVNIIRHDEKLAHMTLDIRQHLTANDIATADFIKGELPSVTFSARFIGGRRYDKLIEYNGEIPIDLDKKTPEELARISAAVTRSPFTHISFTSPKGNGYKLTVQTSLPDGTLPQSPEEVRNYHAHAYDQVAALYEELCQTDIDESGKDMTRICYLPHDENAYLNPAPAVSDCRPQPSAQREEKENSRTEKGCRSNDRYHPVQKAFGQHLLSPKRKPLPACSPPLLPRSQKQVRRRQPQQLSVPADLHIQRLRHPKRRSRPFPAPQLHRYAARRDRLPDRQRLSAYG